MLQYLNSIDPHIKFTVEQPNTEGAIPFWIHSPNPMVRKYLSLYRENLPTPIGT